MKQIVKDTSPAEFEKWKEDFKALYHSDPLYKDFRETEEWVHLREVLLDEQGYICCYCMKRIEDWDSHIEHFIPRADRKLHPHSISVSHIELEYNNLFMSCNGEPKKPNDHCGRKKDSEQAVMLVCPTSPDVENQFIYEADGGIKGVTPEAMTSIRILGLDSYALNRHRETAIYTALGDGNFDPDTLVQVYESRDAHGMYSPYCTAIVYCLKHDL